MVKNKKTIGDRIPKIYKSKSKIKRTGLVLTRLGKVFKIT